MSVQPFQGQHRIFIGRVGALAVALGVGAGFTLGMPGLAWADETESSSTPDPSPKSTSEPDTGPSADPGPQPGPEPEADADPEPEPEPADEDDAEEESEPESEPEEVAEEEAEPIEPSVEPQAPAVPASQPVSATGGDYTSPPPGEPESLAADQHPSAALETEALDEPVDASSIAPPAAETLRVETLSEANAPAAQKISTYTEPDQTPVTAPVAEVEVADTFVAALFSPLVAPGPAAPVRPPLLFFALLDWVRREIQRTFFNQTPHAVVESYSTSEGLDVSGNVLTNDEDPDGDALRASLVEGPAHGQLTLNRDGTFVYTPDANFSGTDSFTYKVKDRGLHVHGLFALFTPDHGHSATSTVEITVAPEDNFPPFVDNDHYHVTAGETLTVDAPGVLANDADQDGDPLTAVKVSDPSHGTLTFNHDGSFTYVADADFEGQDIFEYYAHDGWTPGSNAFVVITVTQEAVPVAGYDSFATDIDTALKIDSDNLLDNDFDNEDDPLTVVVTQSPENGELVDNGDGTYTYTPDDGFLGTDVFEYVAADAGGQSAPAVVSINVGIPANTAPETVSDFVTVSTEQRVILPADLLGNDTDADGDLLTPYIVSDPIHGTLEYNAGGGFTYTPDAGFTGSDAFYYSAFDGYADSAPTLVSIQVLPEPYPNTIPVAGYDSLGTDVDTPLTIDPVTLLANDFDADGDVLWVSVTEHPLNGSLATDSDGNLVYTPDVGFTGTDSFYYSAAEPGNASLPAQVTINVGGPANAAPEAAPDVLTAITDTPLTFSADELLGNDTDAEDDGLSVFIVSDPAGGMLVDNEDGTFTYTPDTGFDGTVSFVYTAFDGQADSLPTLVTIDVGPPAAIPPTAHDDFLSTPVNTPLAITASDLFGNDENPDGDPNELGGTILTFPSHGTLGAEDGVYTPDLGFEGIDAFTYQAEGVTGTSNIATVFITVGTPSDTPAEPSPDDQDL